MMKYTQTLFILWASLLLLAGCAPKRYEKNETRLIIIKSPKLKYADLGYIRHTKDEVKVDLFVAGQAVQSIEVNHLVCVDEGCLTKSKFNAEYLHASYPDDLLRNVLLARPIFEKASMQETNEGFVQNLKSEEYDISYSVKNGESYFKDRQNNLLIKISKTKG